MAQYIVILETLTRPTKKETQEQDLNSGVQASTVIMRMVSGMEMVV